MARAGAQGPSMHPNPQDISPSQHPVPLYKGRLNPVWQSKVCDQLDNSPQVRPIAKSQPARPKAKARDGQFCQASLAHTLPGIDPVGTWLLHPTASNMEAGEGKKPQDLDSKARYPWVTGGDQQSDAKGKGSLLSHHRETTAP